MNFPFEPRFPSHPVPYPDELLLSYVCRLADDDANGISPNSLYYLLFRNSSQHIPLGNGSREKSSQLRHFEKIAKLTGFDEEIFRNTILQRYSPIVHQTLVSTHWINRQRLRICPLCLKESLYYRVAWRLKLTYACPKHKVLLIDTCRCGHPIEITSGAPSSIHPLGVCKKCRADFRDFKPISLESDSSALTIQKKIWNLLDSPSPIHLSESVIISAKEFFFSSEATAENTFDNRGRFKSGHRAILCSKGSLPYHWRYRFTHEPW